MIENAQATVEVAPSPPLPSEALRRRCDPASVRAGQDVDPSVAVVAQDRALRALRTGLEIPAPGFHIFVCGPSGTGKLTTVMAMLKARAEEGGPIPPDRVYVQNFRDTDRPMLLTLPAGQGPEFRAAIDELVDDLRREVPRVFDGETFGRARDRLVARFEQAQRDQLADLEIHAEAEGFVVGPVAPGTIARPDLLVRVEDESYALGDLAELIRLGELPPMDLDEANTRHDRLRVGLDDCMRDVRALAREVERDLQALERSVCTRVMDGLLEDLRERFPNEQVGRWIDLLQARVIERLDLFVGQEPPPPAEEGDGAGDPPPDEHLGSWPRSMDDPYREFRVNVAVDNTDCTGPPLVLETNPTHQHLFGTLERAPEDLAHVPLDHLAVRGGALLRANGGFLVFDGADAFTDQNVWKTLRRTLRYRKLEIQPPPDGPTLPGALKPEPADVNLKVIVLGDPVLYYALHSMDDGFESTFKIKAEFDSEIPLDPDGVGRYTRFLERVSREEELPPVDPTAVAAIVEAGMRWVERRDRLTAYFGMLADWLREAAFEARRAGDDAIRGAHVLAALEARDSRHDLVSSQSLDDITSGMVVIATDGTRIGQLNALTIFDFGDHVHARPCRVTAVVGAGRAGVVSVEREAKLSGRIHSKGVLVLSALLLERFGRQRPLALSASTVFEQTYELLEGDSASSAEMCALLSALAEVPLAQGIAVTGSVTQKGQIRAIGGINEKIEGFYDVCESLGLTGKQGVVVPRANLPNLMLAHRVLAAAKEGRFHIWAVDTIDGAVEILTGVVAGNRSADGRFPPGTINARVALRLEALADAAAADSERR